MLTYRRKQALRHMGSGDISEGRKTQGATFCRDDTSVIVEGCNLCSSRAGSGQGCWGDQEGQGRSAAHNDGIALPTWATERAGNWYNLRGPP